MLGVQSIVSGLMVLAVLVLYFLGSGAFDELKTAFCKAIRDDSLVQVLSQAWDSGD